MWAGSIIGYTRSACSCTLELLADALVAMAMESVGLRMFLSLVRTIISCCVENYTEIRDEKLECR